VVSWNPAYSHIMQAKAIEGVSEMICPVCGGRMLGGKCTGMMPLTCVDYSESFPHWITFPVDPGDNIEKLKEIEGVVEILKASGLRCPGDKTNMPYTVWIDYENYQWENIMDKIRETVESL